MLPIFGVRVSEMVHPMCVHHIIFNWVWVAEWPPFGKELLTRLSICCLCILTICIFSYFPFRCKGLHLGSDCFRSWSVHTLTFTRVTTYDDFSGQFFSYFLDYYF